MKAFKSAFFVFLMLMAALPNPSQARLRRGGYWYGPGFSVSTWRRGYWFHGAYLGRAGWWWVVGPAWYFYESPYYPYPPLDNRPIYVVQVEGAPQPPPAPQPAFAPGVPSPPPGAVALSAPPPVSPTPRTTTERPPGSAKSQAFSYYCEKTKNYYPNVADCPEGWVATPVKAPNQ